MCLQDKQCGYCSCHFSKEELRAHVLEKHKFHCRRCRVTFIDKVEKDIHIMEQHVDKLHTCVVCGVDYRSLAGLQKHWHSRIHKAAERTLQRCIRYVAAVVPPLLQVLPGKPTNSLPFLASYLYNSWFQEKVKTSRV